MPTNYCSIDSFHFTHFKSLSRHTSLSHHHTVDLFPYKPLSSIFLLYRLLHHPALYFSFSFYLLLTSFQSFSMPRNLSCSLCVFLKHPHDYRHVVHTDTYTLSSGRASLLCCGTLWGERWEAGVWRLTIALPLSGLNDYILSKNSLISIGDGSHGTKAKTISLSANFLSPGWHPHLLPSAYPPACRLHPSASPLQCLSSSMSCCCYIVTPSHGKLTDKRTV